MQDKIFKVKIFKVIQKSSKSMNIFSLKIIRLYHNYTLCGNLRFRKNDVTIVKNHFIAVACNLYLPCTTM